MGIFVLSGVFGLPYRRHLFLICPRINIIVCYCSSLSLCWLCFTLWFLRWLEYLYLQQCSAVENTQALIPQNLTGMLQRFDNGDGDPDLNPYSFLFQLKSSVHFHCFLVLKRWVLSSKP